MRYAEIVMIQGEEGRELTDALYSVDGVVAHGATAESIAAAVEHLRQWDYGDADTVYDDTEVPLPWGSDDDIWVEGRYVLTAHLGLGYVSLARVLDLVISTEPQMMFGHGPTGRTAWSIVHVDRPDVRARYGDAADQARAVADATAALEALILERIREIHTP